jgi:hypothetical protein
MIPTNKTKHKHLKIDESSRARKCHKKLEKDIKKTLEPKEGNRPNSIQPEVIFSTKS